jgi:hypothetical protein
MTDLAQRKTKIHARVAAFEHRRQLVIECDPHRPGELYIRAGRQRGYWVPFNAIYTTGARLAAIQEQKERAARRAAKRRERL